MGRGRAAKQQFLTSPQRRGGGAIDGYDRDLAKACLERQNRASHQVRVVRQTVKRNARFDRKRTDARPAQFDHMSITSERPAEVTGDRAHISALAAFGLEHSVIGVSGYQVEPIDMDRARFNLENLTIASEIISARASDADRGESRRRLEYFADKLWKEALNLGW